MRKLPVVSGEKLLKVLVQLGYEIIRQIGSHVRLRKPTVSGDHNITVPLPDELARAHLTIFYHRYLSGTGFLRMP